MNLSESLGSIRPLDMLAFVALFVMSQTGMHLFADPEAAGHGSLEYYVITGGLYLVLLIYFVRHAKWLFQHAQVNWAVGAIIALVLLSVLWSNDPALTLRRATAVVGTTFVGFYLVHRYHVDALARLLMWVVFASAAFSLILVVFWPDIGIHQDGHLGAWRGGFPHKNQFGALMSLGLLLGVYHLTVKRLPYSRAFVFIGVIFTGLMVYMSDSRTAWVMTLVGLLCFPFFQFVKSQSRAVVYMFAAVLIPAIAMTLLYLVQDYEHATYLVGRDGTLTGRTTLWEHVIAFGSEHRWLGYGYGAFWTGDVGVSGDVRALVDWDVRTAHNAYIDLWLQLGFVGVALFALMVARMGLICVRRLQAGDDSGIWLGTFVVVLLAMGMVGGNFIEQNTLNWTLFVATSGYLVSSRAAARVTRRSASRRTQHGSRPVQMTV